MIDITTLDIDDSVDRVLRSLETMLDRSLGEDGELKPISSLDVYLTCAWIRSKLNGMDDAQKFISEKTGKVCDKFDYVTIKGVMEAKNDV